MEQGWIELGNQTEPYDIESDEESNGDIVIIPQVEELFENFENNGVDIRDMLESIETYINNQDVDKLFTIDDEAPIGATLRYAGKGTQNQINAGKIVAKLIQQKQFLENINTTFTEENYNLLHYSVNISIFS